MLWFLESCPSRILCKSTQKDDVRGQMINLGSTHHSVSAIAHGGRRMSCVIPGASIGIITPKTACPRNSAKLRELRIAPLHFLSILYTSINAESKGWRIVSYSLKELSPHSPGLRLIRACSPDSRLWALGSVLWVQSPLAVYINRQGTESLGKIYISFYNP